MKRMTQRRLLLTASTLNPPVNTRPADNDQEILPPPTTHFLSSILSKTWAALSHTDSALLAGSGAAFPVQQST